MHHNIHASPHFPWAGPTIDLARQKVLEHSQTCPMSVTPTGNFLGGTLDKLRQNFPRTIFHYKTFPTWCFLSSLFSEMLGLHCAWRSSCSLLHGSHKHFTDKYLAYLVQSWHLILRRLLNTKVFGHNFLIERCSILMNSAYHEQTHCVTSLPLLFNQKQFQLHCIPTSLHGLFKEKWILFLKKCVASIWLLFSKM